jgi:hypothetical protein
MLPVAHTVDPWSRTVDLLSLPADSHFVVAELVDCGKRKSLTDKFTSKWGPFVRVVDRPSPLSVALDWRDSTKCCYREQLWVAGRARVSGRCAMSGAPIIPGDEIFRPRPTRPAPRNVSAMVLVTAVEACIASDLLVRPGGKPLEGDDGLPTAPEPACNDRNDRACFTGAQF